MCCSQPVNAAFGQLCVASRHIDVTLNPEPRVVQKGEPPFPPCEEGFQALSLQLPVFLGMPAFAPLLMPPMRIVALGSLVGHLIYGLILGGAYVTLVRRTPATA